MRTPTMQTPDTIQPKSAYGIFFLPTEVRLDYESNARLLLDGQDTVMLCYKRDYSEMLEEMRDNECFELCEIFSTNKRKYAYWRDNEIDEDYISVIGNYIAPSKANRKTIAYMLKHDTLINTINYCYTCDLSTEEIVAKLTAEYGIDKATLKDTLEAHYHITITD